MGIVRTISCDQCGNTRTLEPLTIGGGWEHEFTLTYSDYGLKVANICSDMCLARFVTNLIDRRNDECKDG
jgi:hypothetical protein